MKLSELLTPSQILLPLVAEDKWQAIRLLAGGMVQAGVLPQSQLAAVEAALVVREESMTTGMEGGIAIPHAAVDGIPEVVTSLGIAKQGIPFATLDGKPGQILVCLAIPRSKKLQHIRTLAEIAKLLSRPEVREQILDCQDPESVLEVIRRQEC